MKKKKFEAPINPDQVTKTMFDIVEIGLGIVPFDSLKGNTKAALASMSEEDARKAKRKFRKMWRKVVKQQMIAELVRRKSIGVSINSERDVMDDLLQVGAEHKRKREARAEDIKPTAAAIPILAETTFGKVKKREVGLGTSKKEQTDHQRRRRKKIVYQMIWDDYVTPMLENLKTSINKPSDERSSKAVP